MSEKQRMAHHQVRGAAFATLSQAPGGLGQALSSRVGSMEKVQVQSLASPGRTGKYSYMEL